MSAGTPMRRNGVARTGPYSSGSSLRKLGAVFSVSIGPGATAFTVTPYSASSKATPRVNPWMPALAAE
jgi:hypothetical protein